MSMGRRSSCMADADEQGAREAGLRRYLVLFQGKSLLRGVDSMQEEAHQTWWLLLVRLTLPPFPSLPLPPLLLLLLLPFLDMPIKGSAPPYREQKPSQALLLAKAAAPQD